MKKVPDFHYICPVKGCPFSCAPNATAYRGMLDCDHTEPLQRVEKPYSEEMAAYWHQQAKMAMGTTPDHANGAD